MALWDNFGLGDLPKGWAGDVTSAYATQLQSPHAFGINIHNCPACMCITFEDINTVFTYLTLQV